MYLTCAACRQRCLMTSSFWSRGLTTASAFLGVDDRQNRHVAVAQQKADLLIRDLAKGAKPFHSLRADLHLQHIREAHAREDLLPRKRRPEEACRRRSRPCSGSAAAAGRGRAFRPTKESAWSRLRSTGDAVLAELRLALALANSVPAREQAVGDGDRRERQLLSQTDMREAMGARSKAFSEARL